MSPSTTKAAKCSPLVTTSYDPIHTSIVARGQEPLRSPKWTVYISSVSLISSLMILVEDNALGSILGIVNSRPRKEPPLLSPFP
jgi:hypothetical protein